MKRTIFLLTLIKITLLTFSQSENPEISLTINGYFQIEIQPSYPVIISVSILNSEYLNYEFLIEQLPDTIKESQNFRNYIDSVKNSSSFSDTIPNWHNRIIFSVESSTNNKRFFLKKELLQPFPAQYFSLNPGIPNIVYFGVDPVETKVWKQGTIKIAAGFPLFRSNDTIWSEVAVIKVNKDALIKLTDYSNEQLRFTASYWIRRGECNKALIYAEELIKRNPDTYLNTIIMAEVKICQNEHETAMQYLNRSLNLFEQQADPDLFPPEYIHNLINELQIKLMIKSDDGDE